LPHRYPHEAVLRDGRRVTLRPFTAGDVDALHEFFVKLPVEYRRFAWDHVEDRRVVEEFARELDYAKAFPLLVMANGKIIADATLHRRKSGPLRMVGRVKWMIDPEWRGAGLGTLLVNQFIGIARENGLKHLNCMLISDLEASAVKTLETLGFKSTVLPQYGVDPDGNQHDMTMLVMKL
jgi:GNAT superfamily N-acetyltransferase